MIVLSTLTQVVPMALAIRSVSAESDTAILIIIIGVMGAVAGILSALFTKQPQDSFLPTPTVGQRLIAQVRSYCRTTTICKWVRS